MVDDFYKIGQVIEVHGQKIRIKVFENKNSNILLYKGKIIKNVSVGSFVKIIKGYSIVVGKIEGEYIQENNTINNAARFTKESETIDRIIEVSIMGVLEGEKFHRGLIDIPLIFSDVYILNEDEIQKIFDFSLGEKNSICVGYINDYKEEKLRISVNSLFASHIGIFGNTGSGKSNTLAKIYSECFRTYKNFPNFTKSKFLLIDFNGEYENAFDETKKVFKLSTRIEHGDKIPVSKSFMEDTEMWSILFEATEKTQKPFLDKVIKKYQSLQQKENKSNCIINMIEKLFIAFYDDAQLFQKNLRKIVELLSVICNNLDELLNALNMIEIKGSKFANKGSWINQVDDYKNIYITPLIEIVRRGIKQLDELTIFEFILKFLFIQDVCKQYINEDHIAPLIARYNRRINNIKKLFDINKPLDNNWLQIYSLADVNVEFKKILPLIICKYSYEYHKINRKENSLHMIIDEAHNILSTSSERESQTWKDYRLETFEEIIKEGRKFGVFITIASQRPSDISVTIVSQLHNYFIHRLVNNEDIRAIGKAVAFIDNTSYEMISVLPQGACIFTGISSNFPILVQIDLLPKEQQPKSTTMRLTDFWSKKEQ